MSDEARASRLDPVLGIALLSGLASGALYLSMVLSIAFLLPVQGAFGRYGWKAGGVSALSAALAIALVQAFRIARLSMAGSESIMALLLGFIPPFALLAALVAMNARPFARFPAVFRALGLTALISLAAAPGLVSLVSNPEFSGYLESRIRATVDGLMSASSPASANADAYEVSALRASLDPEGLARDSVRLLFSSYAVFLFLVIGGSWWLGNRTAAEGSPGRAAARPLAETRLPYALVWPTLASWASLLAAEYFKAGELLRSAAWNIALVLGLCYAAQGLGIASHFLARWKAPRLTRIAFGMAFVAILFSPPYGAAIGLILPLLGFTEVWIPYRNPKGVGA